MHLAKQSAKTGEPILKSLEYVFPNEGLDTILNQFMLGDNMMVAPMLEKGTERMVVFPKLKTGKWLSDDGKVYKAGSTATIEVPINRLPYFTILQ